MLLQWHVKTLLCAADMAPAMSPLEFVAENRLFQPILTFARKCLTLTPLTGMYEGRGGPTSPILFE